MGTFKKVFAEFLGTMLLVVFGCGTAVLLGGGTTEAGLVGVSLAFGLVLLGLVYVIGGVSGCHVNPAVTIAMLINKKISLKDSVLYILSQFIGAIAGTGILYLLFKTSEIGVTALGQNGYTDIGLVAGLIAEVILTFGFVLVIFGVTSSEKNSNIAGVVIGLALTLVHLLGIRLTGTSVNPARSFGPALFIGGEVLSQVWVFIVGPIIGGILAALTHKVLNMKETK
jgi:MIP family channel proteins